MADYDAGAVSNVGVGETVGSGGITGKAFDVGSTPAAVFLSGIIGARVLGTMLNIGEVTGLVRTESGTPSGSYRTIPKLRRSKP